MALFSVTTLVVFHFALQRDRSTATSPPACSWVTLLFAAMLGINRLFVADHEEGGFDGFLLAPVDRTALLVAKALGAVRLPRRRSSSSRCPRSRCCCSARRRRSPPTGSSPRSSLLADAGIAVVGTLVGALAVQTRARDLIVPLMALPLLIPVVIGAAQGARRRCSRRPVRRRRQVRWLLVLGLYDLVFGLLAYALFDYLLED